MLWLPEDHLDPKVVTTEKHHSNLLRRQLNHQHHQRKSKKNSAALAGRLSFTHFYRTYVSRRSCNYENSNLLPRVNG